jgi:hypothetical protein
MARKLMSWGQTTVLFIVMIAVNLGLTIAIDPIRRHQIGSLHSQFWQFDFPMDLALMAFFAICMRFIRNRYLRSLNQGNLQMRRSF